MYLPIAFNRVPAYTVVVSDYLFLPTTPTADSYHWLQGDTLATGTLEQAKAVLAEPVTLIIPGTNVSARDVILPTLPRKRLSTTLGYAIEESLSEPIERYHIAYSSMPNGYAIRAVARDWLFEQLATLNEAGIRYHQSRIDYDALLTNHYLIHAQLTLVALDNGQRFVLDTPPPGLNAIETNNSYHYIATHMPDRVIDLLQGEFSVAQSSPKIAQRKRIIGIALGVLFGLYAITNSIEISYLNYQLRQANQHVLKAYQRFFPNALQADNVRINVSKALSRTNQSADEQYLFYLLDKLGQQKRALNFEIEALDYKPKILQISLTLGNAETLTRLVQALQQSGIQTQTKSTRLMDNAYAAKLELS